MISTVYAFLFFYYFFLIFSAFIISSYIILAIISTFETIFYFRKNSFVTYKSILASPFSPSISIIAPCYNEGLNIVENVRSLMSLHYVNYQVIIVNDGSKDDSLEKMIAEYDLEIVKDTINPILETKPIRGIYKSKKAVFEKLIVIDKENGGKADALNAGLNFSKSEYVACIDVDCMLIEDALQKMVKPFLERADTKVIATGGVIRIANNCKIENGKLMEVNMPKKLIERYQILEYLRSFLLGRMAWSRLNGLLIISGAFGMFDRRIMIDAGGYDTNTVGEDMEIIVRMRKYMRDNNQKYKIAYIPDPLCWTEAPDNFKTLQLQRNRWTRGTIETLKKHWRLFMNPKYGSLGLLSYPYWLIYERLAPIVEVIGLLFLGYLYFTDALNWLYALSFIIVAYLFSIAFSMSAILSEELTYRQYTKKGDALKLFFVALIEPITFHPFILYSALRGNFSYYFKKKSGWGEMVRKGIGNK
jgi:cellulose synthase/poly-beta-1,6-N-acetylglucosamine synthase-like glycosyltransferase